MPAAPSRRKSRLVCSCLKRDLSQCCFRHMERVSTHSYVAVESEIGQPSQLLARALTSQNSPNMIWSMVGFTIKYNNHRNATRDAFGFNQIGQPHSATICFYGCTSWTSFSNVIVVLWLYQILVRGDHKWFSKRNGDDGFREPVWGILYRLWLS